MVGMVWWQAAFCHRDEIFEFIFINNQEQQKKKLRIWKRKMLDIFTSELMEINKKKDDSCCLMLGKGWINSLIKAAIKVLLFDSAEGLE